MRLAEDAGRDLAARHREVTGVLLFGSVERGDATPGSDIDLLVVLRESALPFLERLTRYQPDPAGGLGIDILPYTEEEIARLRVEPGIIEHALGEGRWIVGPPAGL